MWVSEEIRASQAETALLPASRMLVSYWDALRGEGTAPARADLDLRQLRRIAPALFIAEQPVAGGSFVWRLAGTGLCELFRREVTGEEVLAGWEEFERGVMMRFLTGVTGAHQQAAFRLRFMTDRGQPREVEMVALPMLARDGTATHVLGGLFALPDGDLKHYDGLTPAELRSARFLAPRAAAAELPSPRRPPASSA